MHMRHLNFDSNFDLQFKDLLTKGFVGCWSGEGVASAVYLSPASKYLEKNTRVPTSTKELHIKDKKSESI